MASKKYSFFAASDSVNLEGKHYVGVTFKSMLTNIKKKEVNGKLLVTARAPINGRTAIINKMLGVEVPDTDGTVWVDVVFFDERAERFLKYLGNNDKVLAVIVGKMSYREFPHEDGTTGIGVSVTAYNWTTIPFVPRNNDEAEAK